MRVKIVYIYKIHDHYNITITHPIKFITWKYIICCEVQYNICGRDNKVEQDPRIITFQIKNLNSRKYIIDLKTKIEILLK